MNKEKNSVNHRTTKVSEKIGNKCIKKMINICYSGINYDKNRDIYLFQQEHSKDCYDLVKETSKIIL